MATLNPNAAPFIPTVINIAKAHVSDRLVFFHKSIPQDIISCRVHEYPNLPLKEDESSNTAIEER